MRLNPFKDVTPNPRAEFRKEMLMNPEDIGDPKSTEKLPFSGSELTRGEYNELFEGDSWSLKGERSDVHFNMRPHQFISSGSEDSKMVSQAKEGFMGTSLGAKRSHAHFVTGDGNDVVQHDGNSQRNISVVEAGSGDKTIAQNLGGGDDKSVLFLNNTRGTIYVSGGDGNDSLEIHSRNPNQTYTIIQDPENLPDANDGFQGLRIVTQSVENIREFKSPS